MRIKNISIKNYKCFENLDFDFENLAVFVGENNCGKSALLSAIDDFFNSSGKRTPISNDDFYINPKGERAKKLSITMEFSNLSENAISEFKEYTVTPSVTFKLTCTSDGTRVTSKITGIRMGMTDFAKAFELSKNPPVSNFNAEYERLANIYEIPSSKEAKNKDSKLDSLREYESSNITKCVKIESNDEAYGTVGPNPRISKYIQWILIPAVKDASDEEKEGKNILTELISFAARKKTNFDQRMEDIEASVSKELDGLQKDQHNALQELTGQLNTEFQQISMGAEKIALKWEHDSTALNISPPKAAANIVSGAHSGPVRMFGHGLQRNYLVAIFKALSKMSGEDEDATNLILAFEEPELYQHPPQARLLSQYLRQLSQFEQVLITTHSPAFIHPDFFGKLFRVEKSSGCAKIHGCTLAEFTSRMSTIFDQEKESISSTASSLYTLIHLYITEIFFSKYVVIVEGLEDTGYIEGIIDSTNSREEILKLGVNIIPVLGKNEITPVIELCKAYNIPHYVLYDSDSSHKDKKKSTAENTAKTNGRVFNQLEIENPDGYLTENIEGENYTVWQEDIRTAVLAATPSFEKHLTEAEAIYKCGWKNPKLVYSAVRQCAEHEKMEPLLSMIANILKHANSEVFNATG